MHVLTSQPDVSVAASREIGLRLNAEKTKCLVMSRDQNVGQKKKQKTKKKP